MKKITILTAFLLTFITGYAQFPEGFESATFPPTGWASYIGVNNLGTAQNWQRVTAPVATGTGAAHVRFDNADPGTIKQDWLVTPQFTPTAAASSLMFMHRQFYTAEYATQYTIRVSTTSQTDIASFTTVSTMTETDVPLTYGSKLVDLSAYVGIPIYVAFVMANDDGDNWYVDDVSLTSSISAPACASTPFPADMATDVTVGTVTFTWEAPTTGDAPTSYDFFAGDAPGNVTALVGNYETTSAVLNIQAYDTTIYWKIVPKNAAGSATGCPEWSFTTQSPPGYCLNAPFGQYPGGEEGFTPDVCDGVTVNEIVDDGYAGEYSLVNVVNGQTYQFISGTTDFVTIADTDSNTSFASGPSPLTWVADADGQVRFYSHTDDQCGTEDENRVRAVVCGVATDETPDYANLQFPATTTIDQGDTGTVYGQVYEAGLTDVEPGLSGQAEGIQMWVGVNEDDTNPATWNEDSWELATFNAGSISNNDEYQGEIGAGLEPGTYYYATRFRLNDGPYVYGGTDGTNGNFWDGTTFESGVLTINPPQPPANDNCAAATELIPYNDFASSAITTTNIGATDDGPIPSCQETSGENVWYTVTVPASGSLTFETGPVEGSDFNDSVITVFAGDCAVLDEIACDDDSSTNGLFSLVSVGGRTPGETLYVSVYRYNFEFASGDAGEFQLAAYDASLSTAGFNENALRVFPNPVNDNLNVAFEGQISAISVFNLTGQKLSSQTVLANETSVDMSRLARGAYFVRIETTMGFRTVKVLKR